MRMKLKPDEHFLFYTHTLGLPRLWEHFPVSGIMVNAYEILSKSKSKSKSIIEKGIHKYLNYEGIIAMDSGGFQLMKNGKIEITVDSILDIYDSKPDVGVVLDYPLSPKCDRNTSLMRMKETLKNTEQMVRKIEEKNKDTIIMPVIHGHDYDTVRWYIREINKIGDFEIYGIGSLVPYAVNAKERKGGIYNVVRIVSLVRKLLPDKLIHVFGIGSSITMHLMFLAGANSVDSSAWRTKAAYGAIQLPGIGDRYISEKNKNRTKLKQYELKKLEECKCPACKSGVDGLKNSFQLRAIHNAWVYNAELQKIRKLERNEYKKYALRIIRHSRFCDALSVIRQEKLELWV